MFSPIVQSVWRGGRRRRNMWKYFAIGIRSAKRAYLSSSFTTFGLLICTLISKNQGLEKSRSASNLRKISGPTNLDFFLGLHLEKKLDLYHKPEKIQVTNWKKSRCAGPEIFLRCEADLNFSRPWFYEIKVQIKRPILRRKNLFPGFTGCCTLDLLKHIKL